VGRTAHIGRKLPVATRLRRSHAAAVDAMSADRTPPATDEGDGGASAAGRRRRSLLVFACAVPLAIILLAGVVDVSMNYSEGVQARHGTNDAGRELAAHRLGADSGCWLDEITATTGSARSEACLVKARLHVDPHRARVRILVVDDRGRWTSRPSSENSIVVCTQITARSVTGLLRVALDGDVHQSRVSIGIDELGAEPVQSAWERPLPGTGWDWCRPDTAAT